MLVKACSPISVVSGRICILFHTVAYYQNMKKFLCTGPFSFELQKVEALDQEATFLGTSLAFVLRADGSTPGQPQDGGYDV
jgi:hypothetical protein